MKKNQNGSIIISFILFLLIIIVGLIIYKMIMQNSDNNYQEYIASQNQDYNEKNEAIGFYYNQIPEPSKIMYNTILANKNILKSGSGVIEFPSELDKSIKNLNGTENDNYFQTAWDAINMDNVDLFYVNTENITLLTKTISIFNIKTNKFTLEPKNGTFYTNYFKLEEQIDLAEKQIEEVTNEILKNATGSRYNQIKFVHDWLVDNIEYDTKKLGNHNNIYGAFIEKKVVCEGYADAFKYLLDKLNIPCVLVYGDGYPSSGQKEAHAWNYVQMEDEKWYAVDVTWDDPIYVGIGSIINIHKHDYFLKGSRNFFENHVEDNDVSGTGQSFIYPVLSEIDYR